MENNSDDGKSNNHRKSLLKSLSFYYRMSDQLIHQAKLCRSQGNIRDLYTILERYCSLVSKMPQHPSYLTYSTEEKLHYNKICHEFSRELESLKPQLDQTPRSLDDHGVLSYTERKFITDNASNFKTAGAVLEGQHPTMFWTPCAAHCVNLMLQDIAKSSSKIKNVLVEARAIVVYIYNHGRVLNLMRQFTNGELHRSAVTRFATSFYTLQSLHKNKQALRKMFVCDKWVKSDFAKKLDGKHVQNIIARGAFWDNVLYACRIMAPLVDIIRLVDTEEKPCMGYIYEGLDRAKEQIEKNLGESLRRTTNKIWAIIDKRWETQLHHPLHAAGFYLNPAIYYKHTTLAIEGNAEIKRGLRKAISKLVPNEDENDRVFDQLADFREVKGDFGDPRAIRRRETLQPYEWWMQFGASTPDLQKFALKVLGQTCSASPCERNWSTFDHVKYSGIKEERSQSFSNVSKENVVLAYASTADSRTGCSRFGSPYSTGLIMSEDRDVNVHCVTQSSPSPVLSCIQSMPQAAHVSHINTSASGHGFSQTSYQDLHISVRLMEDFLELARDNTNNDLETCGVLGAFLKNGIFYVTTLIIPKQEMTASSCQALNEEEIYAIQSERTLFPVGWIHTHPSQTCFMSSIDLHTQYSYQLMLPEAVAIVMAPTDPTRSYGIFRLREPGGTSILKECHETGFHSHQEPFDGSPIYEDCSNVYLNPNLRFEIFDLR